MDPRRVDRRQLVRVSAVVVAALALAFLGWRMAGESGGAELRPGALPHDPDSTGYADLVVGLHAVLVRYAPLQGVTDHHQVHAAQQEVAALEVALLEVEGRADAAGADDVASLAATVRTRATEVLARASTDHTDLGGVAAVQAFGREVAQRAVRIGGAVESSPEDGWGPVTDAVAAPWPPPDEEGQQPSPE